MNKKSDYIEERAAIELLRQTGVNLIEAAMIAKEALKWGRGCVTRARACIAAGAEALRAQRKTVTFKQAVEVALLARKDCRSRTINDFRYLTKRLMEYSPELKRRRIRSITAAECALYLKKAFRTPQQYNKGRLAMSGVFTSAQKHGWCASNPVRNVSPEKVVERRIGVLSAEEIARLLAAAWEYGSQICLPAVGLMLYAGIRPHEVKRLTWGDIHLNSGIICIAPRHSKTGGARHVTIHPPLMSLLRRFQAAPHLPICPPNWARHWTALHRQAGFHTWQPDILRHTFATHHLATFRSYAELQVEMGHRSADLLRNRYVAMDGLYLRNESAHSLFGYVAAFSRSMQENPHPNAAGEKSACLCLPRAYNEHVPVL